MGRAVTAALLIIVAVAGILSTPPVAQAAPGGATGRDGKVRVIVDAPDGVPGHVVVDGRVERTVTTAPGSSPSTQTIDVPRGVYRIRLPLVTVDGRQYAARASRRIIVVRPRRATTVRVRYVAAPSARDLHTTAIEESSISLTWDGPPRARYRLRRTVGDEPAAHPWDGVGVATDGLTARDRGLDRGTQYTYALFTQRRGRWMRRWSQGGAWIGPLSVTVGTTPEPDAAQATYVAAPTTLLADEADIVSATPTGDGVRLVLDDDAETPTIGAAVVLPISNALPGGYLGIVVAVSDDGRTIELVAGGLSDAFDFFDVDIEQFGVSADLPDADGSSSEPGGTTDAANPVSDAAPTVESVEPVGAVGPLSTFAAPAALAACEGGAGGVGVTFAPDIDLGGHFGATINKYNVFGVKVPKGASMDMAMWAKATGAMAVDTSASVRCSLPIDPVLTPIVATPVPISFYFSPTAEVNVEGAHEVSNLGFTAIGGVEFSGSLDVTSGPSFSGGPIRKAKPLTPKITNNGAVGATLGGEVVIGPGAGTPQAGVVAGIGGELNVIDARFGPEFTAQDDRYNACLKASLELTRSLHLTAKAWVKGWSLSERVTFDALKGSTPYFGSPWYLPKGCEDLPATEPPEVDPGDDVLGDGVTNVSDSVLGTPNQWGHVDGFVPGQKTWVLSTGVIDDALGTPEKFASTNLGQPGDEELSALAGYPTHDAAAYEVTLVPDGSTLHVRYVFASEEYPEYVNSTFNDVMSVKVDGVNCATVPGTDLPVSVDTINATTNAEFHVDNTSGAAGYSTSMDGLTVPLTCDVAVAPGEPVTVRIAVADTSDSVWDSAVALVDGGIWSD